MFCIIHIILLFLFCRVSVLDTPVASYASNAKIYESLNIPQPPKRPIGVFFRFAHERLGGQKLSTGQRKEALISLGAEWRKLDESTRAKYFPDSNVAKVNNKKKIECKTLK